MRSPPLCSVLLMHPARPDSCSLLVHRGFITRLEAGCVCFMVCQLPSSPTCTRSSPIRRDPINASRGKCHCHLLSSGWVFPGSRHLVCISVAELRPHLRHPHPESQPLPHSRVMDVWGGSGALGHWEAWWGWLLGGPVPSPIHEPWPSLCPCLRGGQEPPLRHPVAPAVPLSFAGTSSPRFSLLAQKPSWACMRTVVGGNMQRGLSPLSSVSLGT